VITLVDWVDSAQFLRVYDVAHALLKFAGRRPDAILLGQVGSSLHRSCVERFAEAYQQEVRLATAERALLPWLMIAQRIVGALWCNPTARRSTSD
jgi:Ser/Thr protein kinase RdoA (MazF antagonist)